MACKQGRQSPHLLDESRASGHDRIWMASRSSDGSKPFGAGELLARILVALRHTAGVSHEAGEVTFKPFQDPATPRARGRSGQPAIPGQRLRRKSRIACLSRGERPLKMSITTLASDEGNRKLP